MHGPQFCDFVESILRIEILKQIEQVDKNKSNEVLIDYVHIRPLKLFDNGRCPSVMKQKLKEIEKDYEVSRPLFKYYLTPRFLN